MPFPLTEEQRSVVDDRGGELLVSAAAGSGKTRVLVERLLERVTEEKLDIDRFLVITYTKAAAAELRGRIAQELADRLAQLPNDRHLRRQTTLVYKAQISTIHAFCSALIRENPHLLELDGDFRLCDEGEAAILMSNVMEQVLDSRYETRPGSDPFLCCRTRWAQAGTTAGWLELPWTFLCGCKAIQIRSSGLRNRSCGGN